MGDGHVIPEVFEAATCVYCHPVAVKVPVEVLVPEPMFAGIAALCVIGILWIGWGKR